MKNQVMLTTSLANNNNVYFYCLVELLLKILKESLNTQTIVFCNTVPSCDWTGRFLESHDIPLVKLHGGLNAEVISVEILN